MTRLDEIVTTRRQAMIGDLREIVGVESVKGPAQPGAPFGPAISTALELMLAKGAAMGLIPKNLDGYAGHLEFGSGAEIIGVLVHLDVVPAGEGWEHPPFGGAIENGRLYSRGAVDDKGPAIACLHALAAMREAGLQPKKRIRLILGGDEESGWDCMKHYLAHEECPAFGFSPDAEFPLIMAEKGHVNIELSRGWTDESAAQARIVSIKGGTRSNTVPESCRAVVAAPSERSQEIQALLSAFGSDSLTLDTDGDKLIIDVQGLAAHASQPEQGINAIGRLCLALRALQPVLSKEQGDVLEVLGGRIGLTHDGAGLDIACCDGVSGALTLNLGLIDWSGEGVRAVLDVRYPVTADSGWLVGRAAMAVQGSGLVATVKSLIPPLHVPVEHPLVIKLMKVFAEKTGSTAPPIAIGGRTYACAIGTGVAYGPIFPGCPEVAHQHDEYIGLDELVLCARIYAAAMAALTEA